MASARLPPNPLHRAAAVSVYAAAAAWAFAVEELGAWVALGGRWRDLCLRSHGSGVHHLLVEIGRGTSSCKELLGAMPSTAMIVSGCESN